MRARGKTTSVRPLKIASHWLLFALSPGLLVGAGWARGADEGHQDQAKATYVTEIQPLIKQYCSSCHNAQKANGGVNFAAFGDIAAIQKDQVTWRKVIAQLRDRSMPPQGLPQPTEVQHQRLIDWMTQTLQSTPDSVLPKNPGRVLIHRLSRTEYNNTVRDLLGVTSNPANSFPADGGGGGGFDNDADTLFIPPILMERYLHTAAQVLREAKPERIFFVHPGNRLPQRAAGEKILSYFAMHAYRRPVEKADMVRLMHLYDLAIQHKQSYQNAVRFALKAVLISPGFLFRAEADHGTTQPYPLNDYELASRLSYFLWSSMPDDTLFQLAAQNRLHTPQVLEAQVRRMLKSPKAHAIADSFASQWLRVRDLYTSAQPDPNKFPDYTPTLRDSMYNETIDVFEDVLQNDASLLQLIDSDYTYLNEELAKHYGIPGIQGPQMRRVALTDRRRGGILTMGSVLTITSYAQRTSPVLRGKWVMLSVLGATIPPPPPNAGGLAQDDTPKEGLTFRQRLEKHRSKPQCASCHARMDPIGFGLENFDVVGRWRDAIGGQKIDSSGVLASGEKFSGPIELKQHILEQKDEFIRNLTEKMLSYALGRGLEPYDLPAVRKITAAVAQDGYRSTTLIREIVKSYPFQYRQNG